MGFSYIVPYLFLSLNVVYAQTNCPALDDKKNSESWQYESLAIHCRSECNLDTDCVIIKDHCGKMAIVNKNYSKEVLQTVEKIKECQFKIDANDQSLAKCEKKHCVLKTESCSLERQKRDDYVKANYTDYCEKNSDCSYLSLTNETCRQEHPVSVKNDFEKNKITLLYLNDRVSKSCSALSGQECGGNHKINQCFIGKCLRVSKEINYVNYVNLEGVENKLNFKSRTKPLVIAEIKQLACVKSEDCWVVNGVCKQNFLSVNKDYAEVLKRKVNEFEKNVSCPQVANLIPVKSDCVQGFCVFVRE